MGAHASGTHHHDDGAECAVAHGDAPLPDHPDRKLVVVYATALGDHLAHWGRELGFHITLLEPDRATLTDAHRAHPHEVATDPGAARIDAETDVVVTDHHRDDLGATMAPLVTARPRFIGIIGSPRHEGPHRAALAGVGVEVALIDTVRRPIGLDIGSRAPAEIALSILGGLLAERNGRRGGLPEPTAPLAG